MIRAVCQLLIAFLVCDTAVYLFSQDKQDLIWVHQEGIIRLAKNKMHYVPRECEAQVQTQTTDDQNETEDK